MIDRRRLLLLAPWLAALPAAGLAASPARAGGVQELTTPRGLGLWLVEERAAPLVAVRFGIPGGSAQDSPGKEGLSTFLLAMLEEGAGELRSRAFKDALKASAAELSFSSERDRITGGVVALESGLDRAAELLSLAVTAPRFDAEAVDRIRQRLLNRLDHAANDSGRLALDGWYAEAFPDHAYGRPAAGTAATLATITRADLVAHHRRLMVRAGLRVVMVGSIGARQAAALADRMFGELPAAGAIVPIAPAKPVATARRRTIVRTQALSAAVFGLAGRSTADPDHAIALVLNHIVGSGDFDARLVDAVRVRRGLTYSIRTSLVSDSAIAVMIGQLSTRNEAMVEALGVVEAELQRMAREGPTDEEVANARSYLSGSLLLGFDGSAKLADGLVGLWLDGHGRDGLVRRREAIERVAVADVARLARDMLRTEQLITVVVGPGSAPQPQPR